MLLHQCVIDIRLSLALISCTAPAVAAAAVVVAAALPDTQITFDLAL